MGGSVDAATVARRIAARVRELPDVVDLSPGAFRTTVTPAPEGRIIGVAVRATTVEIGVVVRYGRPPPQIAAEIREDVRPLAMGRVVHVSVEDVVAGTS
ncbi:putative alkaline shock family protein YloU [Nocardiopsis mwathae]|uniref:Putative alkaline shock family protein YloU n=1 Tax=Nocardiopsis mwathae TaxID=1472723 RepID=A0A7X0D6C2_9ACTN|nr:hypothetical protein [Nocardiopsis mwathae]MBB6173163.1 putative alkaline shock family protein YloU [Nocardiopsis mwathae]